MQKRTFSPTWEKRNANRTQITTKRANPTKADKKTTIPNDVYLYEPRHSHELAKKKCYVARIRSCTCLGKHHRTASCSFVLFDSYACSVHECLICEVKWNLIILKTGIQFHITFTATFYINVTYASIFVAYRNLYQHGYVTIDS